MKIAVFIKGTTFHKGFGGLETQNKILCEGLAQKGHTVTVFAPQKELTELEKLEKNVSYVFVPAIYEMKFALINKNNWLTKSYEKFVELHTKEPFDLVVSQSSAGLGVIRRKRALGIKVVSISHGTILGEFKSVAHKFSSLKGIVKFFLDTFFVFRNFFGRQRAFIYGSSRIIAVSTAVKQAIIDETFVAEDFVTVIHNGVDETKFAGLTRNTESATVRLIYVGRVIREKGLFELIDALDLLKNANVRLAIVGDGENLAALQQTVTAKHLEKQVTFYGNLAHDNVIQKLFESDIFVLPSLRVEGFPMTLVEAMFAGLCVVASKIGGIPDAVLDGETGLLCKAGDVTELKDKLLRLVSDKILREKLGENGKIYAGKELSLQTMLTKYEQVFTEVLK